MVDVAQVATRGPLGDTVRVIGRSPRLPLASTVSLLAGNSWHLGLVWERSITEWPEAGCTPCIVASMPLGTGA